MKLIDREVTILKSVSHVNIIALKEVFETAQVYTLSSLHLYYVL